MPGMEPDPFVPCTGANTTRSLRLPGTLWPGCTGVKVFGCSGPLGDAWLRLGTAWWLNRRMRRFPICQKF